MALKQARDKYEGNEPQCEKTIGQYQLTFCTAISPSTTQVLMTPEGLATAPEVRLGPDTEKLFC